MVDAFPPPDNASPQPDANYGDGGLLNSSLWSLFEPELASAPSVAPSTPKRRRLFSNEFVPAFPPCDEDDSLERANHRVIEDEGGGGGSGQGGWRGWRTERMENDVDG